MLNRDSNSALCEVAILAGGMGSRLKTRTGDSIPKPMAPILDKPLLEYQIESCRQYGFRNIVMLVHHRHEAISDHFSDGNSFGVNLTYVIEETPRGTAGALRDALPLLSDPFLVLYGDTFFQVNLRKIWEAHGSSDASATLFLHPNDHPQDSDLVEVDEGGLITAIHPYPHPEGSTFRNLVNAGLYVFSKKGLDRFLPSEGKADIAKHTFPAMRAGGAKLSAYISPEYIKDMGTPDRLDKVERDILNGLPAKLSGSELRSAIFIDRDGTINKEIGHLTDPEDLELIPGVANAISKINRSGLLGVAITNQPVIARGDLSPHGLAVVHARLDAMLGLGHAYLDRIYFCPHHPDKGFPNEIPELKFNCSCRKPETGLIDQACRELMISRQTSWFVGDTTTDLETGRRAGLKTVLVHTGYAGRDGKFKIHPDYVVPDLAAGIDWILNGHRKASLALLPLAARSLDSRLILVGGLSRSGKSSAAQVLKELLSIVGKSAHVISLDSWLKPLPKRKINGGVLDRYDLDKAREVILKITRRDTVHFVDIPIYDPFTHEPAAKGVPTRIGPSDLIILEGVPALTISCLNPLSDFKVYIETDEVTRVERIRLDYLSRGATDLEIQAILLERDLDEVPVIEESRANSDLIISM